MDLQAAITKANNLQHLVGTMPTKPDYQLLIEAVIPAPTNKGLFIDFVNEFKWQMLHKKRADIDFVKIALSVGATDFDVFALHDGTLHKNTIQMSGDIKFKKLK